MYLVLLITFFAHYSRATDIQPVPTPTPSPAVFDFQNQKKDDWQTTTMIDSQARLLDGGGRSSLNLSNNIASGHARAQEMVDALKTQELQKAFVIVDKRGKQALYENPDLKNPAAIVAGAVALWVGRTFKILKSDFIQMNTRVEARARSGELQFDSPLMNGKLSFTANDGLSVNLNRSIASINSNAEFYYNPKSQSFTGQLRHSLCPNIDLTFGAAQSAQYPLTDSQAKIEYRLSF